MVNVAIPIAGFKDVYDVPAVEKALHELAPSANEALRALYDKMLRVGGQRFTVKPSAMPPMQELFEDLPNFGRVLEDIRKQLALCLDSQPGSGGGGSSLLPATASFLPTEDPTPRVTITVTQYGWWRP